MAMLEIWTDGCCIPTNPGLGGWAAILIYGKYRREIAGFEPESTNNRMELTAPIRALEILNRPTTIQIYSDSRYVVKGITEWIKRWQENDWYIKRNPVKNQDLWKRLLSATAAHTIEWNHVPGHAGIELNEAADRLAGKAAKDQINIDCRGRIEEFNSRL